MSNFNEKKQVTILGSTGSIGVNTLDVISSNTDKFAVFALTAHSQVELMFQQCLKHKPLFAVMVNAEAAVLLKSKLDAEGMDTAVLAGKEALEQVAADARADIVMAAIVGGAGLLPTLSAAKAGKKVLLANKEALVMAGELFMQVVRDSKALLLPIDSEHNAIFQCLPVTEQGHFIDESKLGVDKIVLTASGGPFLNASSSELSRVTPKQACNHPNWNMGPKISVDSATLMNKALEFIEASFLFDLPSSRIEVLVHPQSVVHSMVYYLDGSVLAQLGNPDMRTPIAYGLAWPARIQANVKTLDLCEIAKLSFQEVDEKRFPGLKLGKQAAEQRGTAPTILNAANEIAVTAFLAERLSFTEIPVIIESTLNQQESSSVSSIEEILEADAKARVWAQNLVNARF